LAVSDWLSQLIGPVVAGSVSGLVLVAGLRVEVRNLKESLRGMSSSVTHAHRRIDDHIDRHHSRGLGNG
jgi:putative effector of murein hydrolase LrgA (UPF0299 family)